MQYKNFEDHARNVFSRDTEAVDTAALLGALDLPVTGQTKRSPLWLVMGLGLLLVTGIAVMMLSRSEPSVAVEASLSPIIEASKTTIPVVKTSLPAVDNEPTDRSVSTVAITQEAIDREATIESAVASTRAERPSDRATSAAATRGDKGTKRQATTTAIGPARQNEEVQPSPTTVGLTSATMASSTPAKAKLAAAPAATRMEALRTPISAPPVLGSVNLSTLATSETPLLDMPTDKIKCPTFGPKRGRFSFAVIPEIGVMLPNESLVGVPALPASMIRMQDERALEGLQGALYLKASHSRLPVYLRSGLSYSRISHSLPLTYERVERDTTQGIISLTTSTTGDTITAIIGDIVTETTITGQSTKHYYTHQWDVPVAIGLEQAFGRWIVGIEGGVNINVSTTASGSILRTPSEFGPIESTIDVSRRVGLGFFGGVQLGRNIEGFGEVYLAARARSIPDISSTVNVTTQRYMLYGLHAGYVYRF